MSLNSFLLCLFFNLCFSFFLSSLDSSNDIWVQGWGIDASLSVQRSDHMFICSSWSHTHLCSWKLISLCKVLHFAVNNLFFSTISANFRKLDLWCASLLLESKELYVGDRVDIVVRLDRLGIVCILLLHGLVGLFTRGRCLHYLI